MDPITNIDEFTDAVIQLTEARDTVHTGHFMQQLNLRIQSALKKEIPVSADVYTAWFRLYSLLGQKSNRSRVRSSALGIKDWLKST
jgi:hypothetical protein